MQLVGRVEQVLLARTQGDHISKPVEKIRFIQGHGIQHDYHYGPRLIDVRDVVARRFGIQKGMEVFNTPQWSAISTEESEEIRKLMGIPSVPLGMLGENLVISGIDKFTQLPSGTLFFFLSQAKEIRPTILAVWAENVPCQIVGDALQSLYPERKGMSSSFIKSAKHRRGLVGFVMGSGFVKEGDSILAEIPRQQLYVPE